MLKLAAQLREPVPENVSAESPTLPVTTIGADDVTAEPNSLATNRTDFAPVMLIGLENTEFTNDI